ncbi:MAG: hypothetical protein ACKVKG_18950, partial [Alphaproteobacteria bacterium]
MADTSTALPEITVNRSISTALLRIFAWAIVVATFVFLINNYLIFWRGWPGMDVMSAHLGILSDGAAPPVADRVCGCVGL